MFDLSPKKDNWFSRFWQTTKGKIITIVIAVILVIAIVGGGITGALVYSKTQKAGHINDNIEASAKNAKDGQTDAIKKLTGQDGDKDKDGKDDKDNKDGKSGKNGEGNQDGMNASDLFDKNIYGNSANLDRADVDDVNDFMKTDEYDDVLDKYTTGNIEIPSIDVDLPILEGTTNDNLWAGATTFRPNQSIDKGNYTLLSHNVGYSGMLFSDLPSVKKGSKVKVTSYADGEKKTQEYKITKTEVVDYQDDVDVLNDTKDRKLTLITCLEPDNMEDRFVVTAEPV